MRPIRTFSLVVLIALASYLGSYLTLVKRGCGELDLHSGIITWYPTYRFSSPHTRDLAGTLYAPLHGLDRAFLRRAVWKEQYDASAVLAELASRHPIGPTNSVAPNRVAGRFEPPGSHTTCHAGPRQAVPVRLTASGVGACLWP